MNKTSANVGYAILGGPSAPVEAPEGLLRVEINRIQSLLKELAHEQIEAKSLLSQLGPLPSAQKLESRGSDGPEWGSGLLSYLKEAGSMVEDAVVRARDLNSDMRILL